MVGAERREEEARGSAGMLMASRAMEGAIGGALERRSRARRAAAGRRGVGDEGCAEVGLRGLEERETWARWIGRDAARGRRRGREIERWGFDRGWGCGAVWERGERAVGLGLGRG